jgi:hypothetical protein
LGYYFSIQQGVAMHETVFLPLATFQPVIETARRATDLMQSGTDKIAQTNFYASLAAIDNSAHHFSTLVHAQGIDDLIELQVQSIVPATESVRAYLGQLFGIATASCQAYWQHMERQMTAPMAGTTSL